MPKYQFTLRTLFIFVAWIALLVSFAIYHQRLWDNTNRQNAERAEKTYRQNAEMSYWTMRTNLEASKSMITPADYQQLRQEIDSSWKKLNPSLVIPDGEAPK